MDYGDINRRRKTKQESVAVVQAKEDGRLVIWVEWGVLVIVFRNGWI